MYEQVYITNYELEDTYWWFVARNRIVIELTNKYTTLAPDDYVLDFGCGTGGFASLLAKNYNVICIDSSEIAIEYCKKRGLNLAYQTTIEEFNPEDIKIKAIFALDVIEHIDDDIGTLARLHQVLEPKGYLIVTVPAYKWLWSNHDILHMHKRRYTKKQLKAIISQTGFEIKYISYFNFFLFLPAILKRIFFKEKSIENTQPVDPVPESLNKIFTQIFLFEKNILKFMKFPFGLSIVAIAKKI